MILSQNWPKTAKSSWHCSFKIKKCVKCANEMADDILHVHSTQYYMKYINGAILANLQHRTLKLCRLIVLQETYLWLLKIMFPWQLTLFQSSPTWFQYVSDFQLEKHWKGPQTWANIFICLLDHALRKCHSQTSKLKAKEEQKSF